MKCSKMMIFIMITITIAAAPLCAYALIVPFNDIATAHYSISEKAPIAIDLQGQGILSPPGLEKITFIDFESGSSRIIGPAKSKTGENYALLGRGLKWKTLPTTIMINATNQYGITDLDFAAAASAAFDEWDSYTAASLFDGAYSFDETANWDDVIRDGRNELSFGQYPQAGVIAVTNIWGRFSGPIEDRRIVEFDILFDTDYSWGNDGIAPRAMDLQNIATHELGHGLGLNDLYYSGAIEETMYGYSGYGETKKRTLNTGDIAGIRALYGP